MSTSSLRELAGLFLKLGTTAFGGPAAHIAMMEDEVVRRRGWLSAQEFVDLLGATNMIPGPNSTEMAIHIGWHRARWPGLLVAGICFIVPAAAIVTAFAWAYVRYGTLPEARGLLYGIKPVIIAIVLQAVMRLAPAALKTRTLIAICLAAVALSLAGVHELLLLAAGGLAALIAQRLRAKAEPRNTTLVSVFPFAPAAPAALAAAGLTVAAQPTLTALLLIFAKIGAVLFGSGYVLLAFLRGDFVERLGWLSEAQLLDAIAVGQITPGPVFTTATFVGYLLLGLPGAVAATVGIFLPAFAFVAAIGPFLPRLRKSATAGAVLDGLNAASLALMAAVTMQLAASAIVDVTTLLLALAAAVALYRYKLGATVVVVAGGICGIIAGASGVV